MTKIGIVSFLWEKNNSVVDAYLARNPDRVVLTLDTRRSRMGHDRLKQYGDRIISIDSLLSREQSDFANKKTSEIISICTKVFSNPEWAGYLSSKAIHDSPLFSAVADKSLRLNLPVEFVLISMLNAVLRDYAIEMVVVNEDVTIEGRTAVEWARNSGIPSLHLSHGAEINSLKPLLIHSRLHADFVAVGGDRSAEAYYEAGIAKDRVCVTGDPACDKYADLTSRRSAVKAFLQNKYELQPNRPLIVFATTWSSTLTAFSDPFLHERTLSMFVKSARVLVGKGKDWQFVVKDRPPTHIEGEKTLQRLLLEEGLDAARFRFSNADTESWVLAAEVLVAVNSVILVEGMIAGTPVINLTTDFGLLFGPCFEVDSGVSEVFSVEALSDSIERLVEDEAFRVQSIAALERSAPRYNLGLDGGGAGRVVNAIMAKGARKAVQSAEASLPRTPYVWEQLLEVSDTDATQYHNWPRSELVDLAPRPLRRVLDIGCAAGKTGEYIKQKFPQAKVYGVEVNLTAAELAAKRLDGVYAGKFEDFDFAAYGIAPGSLDTVIVADVLEHLYDPWGVLVRLRPYLTPDAQILASIPNTRNLALMNGLAEGDWRYEAWGLLDVTHIRFFTLKEIRRFFHETGYRVVSVNNNLDSRLADLYQEHRDKPVINIDFDRFTLKKVAREELAELCTLQFFVVAEPGAVDNEAFVVQEKASAAVVEGRTAYGLWRSARELTKIQGDLYEQRMAAWRAQPGFHLAVIADPFDEGRLGASIQSLAGQYYHKLRITVVSPTASPANWADSDRLAWRQATEGGLIVAANQALLEGGSDWVGMVDAGDTVAVHSFLFIAEAINTHPDWRFIYTDEDEMTPEGKYELPRFKPDFNLDLLRSTHYTGGLALFSTALFGRLNGLDPSMKGAEDYDLALRAYNETGAIGIGHIPDVLYHRSKNGGRWCLPAGELVEAGKLAVESHLLRSGIRGAVEHGLFPASYRLRYVHGHKPRVSILVAVRDQIETVQRCIESVLGSTRYPNYELLLIDNDSTHPESRAFLAGMEAMGDERIRVYSHPSAASLPQLHNLLAREATGDYLLFLYFDAAIVQEDWLDSLMTHGLRADVGLVAPRLLRSDGTVEQTGLVLGLNKAVDTVFHGEAIDHAGYMGRAHLEQDFSALGGGCLLVRKTIFTELGGFDAENFAVAYAEVDFSRRAIGKGWLAVWTPFVNVLCSGKAAHHAWRNTPIEEESLQSRRGAAMEHLYQRYLPQLARDTAYNVNLSLSAGAYFSVEACSSLTWDPLPWRPLPRILVQPADNAGCGEYRVISPARALVNAGRIQGWTDFHIFTAPEMARLDVDSIVLQRQTMPEQLEAIARHKKFNRALKVYELDDLLIKLPMKSTHRTHMPKDINRKLRQAIAMCDRFVVSTEPLKEAYRDYHPDIRVVPNCVERARWGGFASLRRQSERPRVGWAGGIGHTGDLEMISSVVKALADQVDWVFMGMCPDEMRPWIKEFHPGVPLEQFPAKLASLNLDLAIAPLELNPFNEAKSHLRLLEYGILGYPVVCSDAYPYRGDCPVTRVRNRHKDWVDAILDQVSDLDRCAQNGNLLRSYVESRWILEDNLDMWMKAWLP